MELVSYFLVSRLAGEIVSLVGISAMLGEFLSTVIVVNQPPVMAADGMIALIGRGQGRLRAGRVAVLELRYQKEALRVGLRRKAAKLQQGWIEINEARWLWTHGVGL